MSTSEVLTEQHTACYDEDGWFVSLRKALEGVTAVQADWKPVELDHSIRETVDHIIFWNDRWLQRIRGELNEPQDVENSGTFKSDESDWERTIEKLWAVMDKWREKLAGIDDEKLDSPVNAEYQAPWSSPLANQNVHNAYHVGQIVLLRKLHGSWDPSKGVS